MTDRSVSWTDADRVASLLARAGTARRGQAAGLARSMGAPDPSPRAAARPMPAAAAAPASPKPAHVGVKEPPPLQQTSDNPSDRLDALVAWTFEHHRVVGAFVADDNGLTLAAHGISEAHVSIVGPLLSALVGVRAVPGIDATAGALWLGANMMSWVEARTERGGFCLGTIGQEPLSIRELNSLKEALETTVHGL